VGSVDRETGLLVLEFDRALRLWSVMPEGSENLRIRPVAHVQYVTRLLRGRGVWAGLVEGWAAADERGDADAARRMAWAFFEQGDRAGWSVRWPVRGSAVRLPRWSGS
jgi:hypothetical protein